MIVVVDASVAVKWYVAEERRDVARNVLTGDHTRIAPQVMLVEVANVLSRKVRDGLLTDPQAQASLEELASGVVDLVPDRECIRAGFDLSTRFRHAVYDCLYLAVAETRNAVLVTDDRTFGRKCLELGFSGRVTMLQNLELP